jgi:hypothetical protein
LMQVDAVYSGIYKDEAVSKSFTRRSIVASKARRL